MKNAKILAYILVFFMIFNIYMILQGLDKQGAIGISLVMCIAYIAAIWNCWISLKGAWCVFILWNILNLIYWVEYYRAYVPEWSDFFFEGFANERSFSYLWVGRVVVDALGLTILALIARFGKYKINKNSLTDHVI